MKCSTSFLGEVTPARQSNGIPIPRYTRRLPFPAMCKKPCFIVFTPAGFYFRSEPPIQGVPGFRDLYTCAMWQDPGDHDTYWPSMHKNPVFIAFTMWCFLFGGYHPHKGSVSDVKDGVLSCFCHSTGNMYTRRKKRIQKNLNAKYVTLYFRFFFRCGV